MFVHMQQMGTRGRGRGKGELGKEGGREGGREDEIFVITVF